MSCQGNGGRDYGKAGTTFLQGDPIVLLLRIRDLPIGQHILGIRYYKYDSSRTKYVPITQQLVHQQTRFSNSQQGWAVWLNALQKARAAGIWKAEPYIDNKWLQKDIEYCVNCPLE